MKSAKRSRLANLIQQSFSIHNFGSKILFRNPLRLSAALMIGGAFAISQARAETVLTFQQNVGGYTGVLDTLIVSTSTAPASTAVTIGVDGGASSFQDLSWSQGLFSFGNLYGNGPGQIPLNATITGASLALTTDSANNSQSGNTYGIYRLNTGFTSGATWANSYGGDGIQVGVETAAADHTQVGGTRTETPPGSGVFVGSTVSFNVLNSLNFWKSQADPNLANTGWLLSTIAGTDAWIVRSSDNTNAASRPKLSVTYVIPNNITWNSSNLTGTWEDANSTNQVWTNNTTTLPTSFANIDNVFFSESPASPVDITVNGSVSPSTMTVSHTSGSYAFNGGSITSLLTKTGGGTLVLNAANNFSSATLSGGTVAFNAESALGTDGLVTLDGGVLLHTTIDAANANSLRYTFNGTSTVETDSGTTFRMFGASGGNGVLNKTGAGTLQFMGTSSFTGSIDIHDGSVLLTDTTATGGDLNVAAINVRNGGLFQFGNSTPSAEENPDLPNNTMITINSGGTTAFTVGEQFGGIVLNGGTFTNFLANPTQSSSWVNSDPSVLMSGEMNGNANLVIGAAHIANKTTSGTITVTGLPIVVTGTLNIQEGVFSTDALISGNGALNVGTTTQNATLQLRANSLTYAKSMNVGDAGAMIDVTDSSGNVTWSGAIGGNGGTLTKTGTGKLTLNGVNTTTGPININAGTLSLVGISNGGTTGPLGLSSSAASNLVINGGNLQYAGFTTTTNRGFTVSGTSSSVEVTNAGTKLTFTGATAGSGNLNKTGAGTLVLQGANGYTGTTTVSNGTLAVAPFNANGGFTVESGATLNTLVSSTTGTLSMPSLSLAAGGSTLGYEIGIGSLPTSSLINVTNVDGLNLNGGTQTINIKSSSPLSIGTYKLIDYAGGPITSGFSLGALGGRALGGLVYNTADTRIDLNITATDSIKWNGNESAVWDVGSAANVGGTNNWKLASNSSATNFIVGDIVTFDDTAAGNFNVNLTTSINASTINVNNSTHDYAFQGTGTITGTGSLIKSGTGKLTIETNNDYTGDTTISQGTLQIGTGGTTGSIGSGNLVNNGTFVINRSDNFALNVPVTGTGNLIKQNTNTLTLSGAFASIGNMTIADGIVEFAASQPIAYTGSIDGTGILLKSGDSVLNLSGNNTHTGGTNITAGTLIATNATGSAVGTGTTTLSAGTTLQIGNGGTAGNVGGTISMGTSPSTGNIVIDRADNFVIGANISGGGTITKNGSGKATLQGNLSYTGTTTINAGTLALAPTSDFTYSATTTIGANTLEINSTSNVRFNNPVTGTGNIIKTGTGNAIFNGASTGFTGTLTINGGTFILQDDQSTTGFSGDINAADIIVNNGGKFQFGSGQSITGENPDLPGNTYVTVNAGGQVDWYIGEDFGGMHIYGGTVNLSGNANLTSSLNNNIWESGTVTGIGATRAVGSSGVIVKTTGGTITVNNVNLNNTGGLSIENGTISTNAGITNTGILSFGTTGVGATVGILQLTNTDTATNFSSSKALLINDGGAVIDVTTAGKNVIFTGIIGGPGSLTKAGAGNVIITSSAANVGTTTITGGKLQIGNTGTTGSLGSGAITNNALLAFNRTNAFAVSNAISGTGNVEQNGTGTTTLSGANTYAGTTTVANGTLAITGSHSSGGDYVVGPTTSGNLAVNGGTVNTTGNLDIGTGSVTIASSSSLTVNNTINSTGAGVLNVNGGGTMLSNNLRADTTTIDGTATIRSNGGAVGASKVETLSIGAAGKINLKDNDLVVGTGIVAAVRAQIKTGVAGAAGITSDLPAFGVTTGFGYALGNDTAISPLLAGNLSGQSYDADSVLVKYTFLGDADLDGDSDLNDLGLWAQSFTGDLGNPAIPATFWTSGDFDYDGDTDLNDLGFWASTFTGDLGGGAGSLIVVAPVAPAGAVAALNSMGITVVPEPSTFVLAGIGLAGLGIKVRRRKFLKYQ